MKIIGIVMLLAAVFATPWLLPLPDAPDLPDPMARPLPEPNGLDLALKAAGQVVTRSEAVGEAQGAGIPTPDPPPVVREHLRANAAALATLDRALAIPEWAHRTRPESFNQQFPYTTGLRELARLKSQQSLLRRQEGDLIGALDLALDAAEAGDRLCASRGVLIDWLVGVALHAIGMKAVAVSLGPPPAGLSADDQDPTKAWPLPPLSEAERSALRDAIARIDSLSYEPAGLVDALANEGLAMATTWRHLADQLASSTAEGSDDRAEMGPVFVYRFRTPFYDAEHTTALTQRMFAELIGVVEQPAPDRDWSSYVAFAKREGLDNPRLRYNAAGRTLLAVLAPVGPKVLPKLDQTMLIRDLTVAALAVRLYADDHGRLPETLDALVADGYLDAVPTDPYTDEPPIYNPRKGVIYGVGKNLRDDGGEAENPPKDAPGDADRPDDWGRTWLTFVRDLEFGTRK